ncbi:MAG: alpha/beta fold hydrolase [Actinobacteria bacterium]|nr:alpha/beta fold hydrolase [Actinomycetota bacterium]
MKGRTGRGRPRAALAALAALAAFVPVLVLAACVSVDDDARTVSTNPAPPPTAGPGGGPSSSEPPAGRTGQLTPWRSCGALECATLTVPLDWSKPDDGRTIRLAVARTRATGAKVGSLVVNPGGPGEGGVEFLRGFLDGGMPAGLTDRLDVVSWDPRGTGSSAPARCRTDAELQAPDVDPTLDDAAEIAAYRARAARVVAACRRRVGDELGSIGTWDTVRDLEALRKALGDARLTYLGYSYGTLIGTEYLRTFPDRVRAMVLDGVALSDDPVATGQRQLAGFEGVLDRYLAECPTRPTCPFTGDPVQAFRALVATFEAGRTVPGAYEARRGTVGIGELYNGVLQALYLSDLWPLLDQSLSDLQRGSGARILYLRDVFNGRQEDGSWSAAADAFTAISCADQRQRASDADGDDRLRTEWPRQDPLLGSVFATGTPGCYGFPAARHPLTKPKPGEITATPTVVLIGNTQDPATPYSQAQYLRRAIVRSVLVTYESADHTAYRQGASRCLLDPVTTYLVEARPPSADLRCRPG